MASRRNIPIIPFTFTAICFIVLIRVPSSLGQVPLHLLCSIPQFDFFNLTAKTWSVTLEQKYCRQPQGVDPSKTPSNCYVLMAFCRSLEYFGACENSSVCQQSSQGNFNLGASRDDPFETIVPFKGSDGFESFFPNGGPYKTDTNTSCDLSTKIAFMCNVSVPWNTPVFSTDVKEAPHPTSISYNKETCQLTLVFDYAGACKIKSYPEDEFSAGTVLIVIFFVTIVLYFTFGSMINIAWGKKGSEIIPHSKLWGRLPVYIVDGCQFVFCCGRKPVTATYDEIE